MSQSSFALSARSFLIAGVGAALVSGAVVSPAGVPALNPAKSASAAVALSAVTTPLENAIKNTYDFVEPWVAYGFELTQYVLSFIPGVWWLAPAIDLGYFTIEPLVQSGVFVFADIIGLDFGQIWPDITAGVTESIANAVDYALAWLYSIVPLPPFPPFPPLPGASVLPSAASAESASLLAAPSARSITTPIEVGIKNTYNFAEGWASYGMQWAGYALGRIPVVNWFTPAIPLVYNTIEPLVRGGVYSFADLIGLNFAAIGPDIWAGITTSVNNAIQGVLNWINIPVPPLPPISAAAVPAGAASVRAAAIEVADAEPTEAQAPKAVAAPAEPATENESPKADATVADTPDATKSADAPAADLAAPAIEASSPESVADEVPAAETPATETPKPTRTVRRGHSAPVSAPVSAGATDDAGAGSSAKAERPNRKSRAHSRAG